MAVTATLIDTRFEGIKRIDRWKVAHTTGGGTFDVDAGVVRANLVHLNDSTVQAEPGATEYVSVSAGEFQDTITLNNQANNSTRFVELEYGHEVVPQPAL